MNRYLAPFADEITLFAATQPELLAQAILLWKLFYQTALEYQREHKDWIFVRHEDLSRDPIRGFAQMFEKLGLEFSPSARATIEEHSSGRNPGETQKPVGSSDSLKLNSERNIFSWKRSLSASQISKIRSSVEPISSHYYSDADW